MYRSNYEYECYIFAVTDGDTFKCQATQADFGFGKLLVEKMTLRLEGIDTPETSRPRNDAELKHGLEAGARTRELIEHTDVWIKTVKYKTRHGEKTTVGHRYRAHLWFPYVKGFMVFPENQTSRLLDQAMETRSFEGKTWVRLVWLLKLEGFEKRDEY